MVKQLTIICFRMAMNHLNGTYISQKKHSIKALPPVMINKISKLLRQSMIDYMSTTSNFLGFPIPFSLSANKDTSKHRSRQVI